MPRPFAVRVRRLADDTEQDMPYKSFLYIKDDVDDVTRQVKFELVGEVDSQGNLVPGNPNLDPQYHKEVPQVQRSAEPVADAGVQKQAPPQDKSAATPQTPKRRGRPAQVKLQETEA